MVNLFKIWPEKKKKKKEDINAVHFARNHFFVI